MTYYVNSENEKISVEEIKSGEFVGHHVLVLHDDPEVSNTKAPMLLDEGTVNWLIERLEYVKAIHTEINIYKMIEITTEEKI